RKKVHRALRHTFIYIITRNIRYKVPLAVPCNTISNRSPLRNLLNLCTKLPDKGEEVKHAKGKSLEMFHNLLFKIRFHR
ncbi:hypothetical protein, partial [Bacteroides stercoris]|uniref:hypothetical protein n=1 Tax=Bacteroides stercoris TaxID=46506 RepID=UPI001C713BE2